MSRLQSIQLAVTQLDLAMAGLVEALASGLGMGPKAVIAALSFNGAAGLFDDARQQVTPDSSPAVTTALLQLAEDCRARAVETGVAAAVPPPFTGIPLGFILNATRQMSNRAHEVLQQAENNPSARTAGRESGEATKTANTGDGELKGMAAIKAAFAKKGVVIDISNPSQLMISGNDGKRIIRENSIGAPPDGFPVHGYIWGFNIYFSGANINWIGNSLAVGGAVATALVGVLSGIPIVNVFAWILVGYILAEFILINSMNSQNNGNGVYVSMSWFAPGIFVPTPA